MLNQLVNVLVCWLNSGLVGLMVGWLVGCYVGRLWVVGFKEGK